MIRLFSLCLPVFFIVSCSSCKSTSSSSATSLSPVNQPDFREKKWMCVELNGKNPSSPGMFIVFSDSSFGGRGACNSYGGKMSFSPPVSIRLMDIVSTEMACDGLGAEQEFFNTLQTVDRLQMFGDTLALVKGKGIVSVKFTPAK